jgi:hypothetical protein
VLKKSSSSFFVLPLKNAEAMQAAEKYDQFFPSQALP